MPLLDAGAVGLDPQVGALAPAFRLAKTAPTSFNVFQ